MNKEIPENKRLIKDIEACNREEKNMYIDFDKQTFEYMGTYFLLDELLNRIEKCNDINIIEKYCNLYEKIYKLTNKEEIKKNYGILATK